MNTTIDSVGVLLKKSWEFYKKNWKDLSRLVLGYIGAYAAFFIISLICVLVFGSLVGLLPKTVFISSSLQIIQSIIYKLASLVLTTFAIFSFPKFIHDLDNDKKPGVLETFKSTISNLKALSIVTILATSLLYGGTLVFIIPGIIFYYGIIFYMYTASIEGKTGSDALIQSYWYTNGKKWVVFFRLLLTSLVIGFVCLFSVIFIVGVAYYLHMIVLTVILSILSVLFLVFSSPFSVLPSYFLYKNLKSQVSETVDPEFYVKKKKKFKIFIWIGLIILVLSTMLSTILSSFFQNLEKTYRNEKSSYSLRYPAYFAVSLKEKNSDLVFIDSMKNLGENVVIYNTNKKTAQEVYGTLIDNIKEDPNVKNIVISPAEDTFLGKNPAKKTTITYTEDKNIYGTRTDMVYSTLSNGFVFVLEHSCKIKECDDKAFDRMLESFNQDDNI